MVKTTRLALTAMLAATVSLSGSCTILEALLGGSSEAESAREALETEAPSASLVKEALSDYDYSSGGCTATEARYLLSWMGAGYHDSKGEGDVTGKLGSGYYITIWNDTYDKAGVYGFRYGLSYSTYWSSNTTYFEIKKP